MSNGRFGATLRIAKLQTQILQMDLDRIGAHLSSHEPSEQAVQPRQCALVAANEEVGNVSIDATPKA